MVDELMNTGCANNGEPFIAPKSLFAAWSSPVSFLSNPLCSEMSIRVLAAHCLSELDHYRRSQPHFSSHSLGLGGSPAQHMMRSAEIVRASKQPYPAF